MNFFAHQALARRQTRRMLVLFALAVCTIIAAIDVVLLALFGGGEAGANVPGIVAISLAVALAIGLGSLYRVATLRQGGSAVALQLGARPVAADTRDFAYRRLRNVVEEVAIAAGVPVPEVFVLEEEAGINAFAAGYAPTDAAITVTRGALDKLTRAELQGVIGHEFSHVLNGDMRLNIRLIGVVFGIVVISTVGRKIAQVGGRGRDAAAVVAAGLALFVVGYLGVVFARLIKASISRQREYLADASAVQFTRQPQGIAQALKKIGALAEGSKLAAGDREEVAHMLFGDGVGYSALFATHPPLQRRILRLDPSFRQDELAAIARAWTHPLQASGAQRESEHASIAGFVAEGSAPLAADADGAGLPGADAELHVSPSAVVEQVGNPGSDDRAAARVLHRSIPLALRELAWQPSQVIPLLYAMVLHDEADLRARQSAAIASRHDAGLSATAEAIARQLAELHPMQYLPLAALAFPALRRRPVAQLEAFSATLAVLIAADSRVSLAEYCLATLVRVQVMDALRPAKAASIGRARLPGVEDELLDVLAILARHGHTDDGAARRAYFAGREQVLPHSTRAYTPPADWVSALDRALPRLDLLAPAGKELVVAALTCAISDDGAVTVAEAELLRTVCAALHCPLPPLLQEPA